jgi:hypothetical protein
MNQSLSASFNALFTDIWNVLTDTEEVILVEVQRLVDEGVALRATGLSEEELNLLFSESKSEIVAEGIEVIFYIKENV